MGLFGSFVAERKRLKKIEFEAYKQKKEDIAFAKKEKAAEKRKQRELAARMRGRKKAETPFGIGVTLQGTRRTAGKAKRVAGKVGAKAKKAQEMGLLDIKF